MSDVVTLHANVASATLHVARGGLLSGLTLADGRGEPARLLWLPPDFSPAESGWPGGGLPVCFPFAGRVFHEGVALKWKLGGVARAMPIHGFAYAVPWTLLSAGPAHAELQLKDGPQTRDLYPYAFTLTARYELTDRALALKLRVESGGALAKDVPPELPVALGLHPYFNAPLRPTSRLDECVVESTAAEKVRVTPAGAAGKASAFPEDVIEQEGRISDPLFQNLILGRHKEPRAALVDRDSKLAIEVTWREPAAVRYVVLWGKGTGFHCLEPWMGLPDAVTTGMGVQWLAKGKTLELGFTVKLSDRRLSSP